MFSINKSVAIEFRGKEYVLKFYVFCIIFVLECDLLQDAGHRLLYQ